MSSGAKEFILERLGRDPLSVVQTFGITKDEVVEAIGRHFADAVRDELGRKFMDLMPVSMAEAQFMTKLSRHKLLKGTHQDNGSRNKYLTLGQVMERIEESTVNGRENG